MNKYNILNRKTILAILLLNVESLILYYPGAIIMLDAMARGLDAFLIAPALIFFVFPCCLTSVAIGKLNVFRNYLAADMEKGPPVKTSWLYAIVETAAAFALLYHACERKSVDLRYSLLFVGAVLTGIDLAVNALLALYLRKKRGAQPGAASVTVLALESALLPQSFFLAIGGYLATLK